MAITIATPADRIVPGQRILVGHMTRWVHEVSSNSLGDVVLRCAFSDTGYPGTTLLRRPHESIDLLATTNNGDGQ